MCFYVYFHFLIASVSYVPDSVSMIPSLCIMDEEGKKGERKGERKEERKNNESGNGNGLQLQQHVGIENQSGTVMQMGSGEKRLLPLLMSPAIGLVSPSFSTSSSKPSAVGNLKSGKSQGGKSFFKTEREKKQEALLPAADHCTTIQVKATGVYDIDGKLLPWLKSKRHKSIIGDPPFILPRKKSTSEPGGRSRSASVSIKHSALISPPIVTSKSSQRAITANVSNCTDKNKSGVDIPTRVSLLEQNVGTLTHTVEALFGMIKDLQMQCENLKTENALLVSQMESYKPRKASIVQSTLSKVLSANIPKEDVRKSYSVFVFCYLFKFY